MTYKYSSRITVGTDADGKPIRKRIYANSQKGLIQEKVKALQEYDRRNINSDMPFIDYAEKYIDTFKANKSLSTYTTAQIMLKKCESIFDLSLGDITNMDCQSVINEYWDKPETVRQLSLLLSQIFEQCILDGILSKNPALRLKKPRVVKVSEDRELTSEEKERSLELINSDELDIQPRMFLTFLYYFGMRPEEVRGLMTKDFNWKSEEVTVQRAVSFPVNAPVIKETKTGMVRTMPIPRRISTQIKAYCKESTTSLLFTQASGNAHSKTSYRRMWYKIKKAIGSETLVPYHFRKSYATTLYYSGISLKMAAYLLGHSDTRMLLKYYAQLDSQREDLDAIRNL